MGRGEERGRERREGGRGEREGEERGRERREGGRGEREGEERGRERREGGRGMQSEEQSGVGVADTQYRQEVSAAYMGRSNLHSHRLWGLVQGGLGKERLHLLADSIVGRPPSLFVSE